MVEILYTYTEIDVTSLAGDTAKIATSKIDTIREQGFRVSAVDFCARMTCTGTNSNVIICGLAVGQTVTQVTDTISANPEGLGNRTEQFEQNKANTPLWPFGVLIGSLEVDKLDGGKMIHKKLNWSVIEDDHLDFFCFNASSAAVAATTKVFMFIKVFGVWLRD